LSALEAYQRQLWARIVARKPSGIHLAGVATVRFSVRDDGALIDVELAASSGNAALDRLALRTVRNAAPFPAPPMGVERDQLDFTIPFSFH
jgi:protein TonB